MGGTDPHGRVSTFASTSTRARYPRAIVLPLRSRPLLGVALAVFAACQPKPPPPAGAPSATAAPTCETPEEPCVLADHRVGWCDAPAHGVSGPCRDLCGPGQSYSNTDTACHRPCGDGCKGRCAHEGLCFEDAPPEGR